VRLQSKGAEENKTSEKHIYSISMLQRSQPVIFTIGYGNRTPEQLLQILQDNHIDVVWDIRANPHGWSGFYRYPKIASWLRENKILYRHFSVLGNPSKKLEDFRLSWATKTFILSVIERQKETNVNVCLLCAEKDPQKCHRSLIVKQLGLEAEVKHL